jgi:L-alanine-DL-glutamate epimerase-like enolase superfamily enzyme
VGGVETALWDLLAKKAGCSVAKLAGGGIRKEFRAYGSSMSREIKPLEEAQRLTRLRQEHGFDAFKIRVGKVLGKDVDAWPGRSEDLVRTVRRELGSQVSLLVDGNSGFSPAGAIKLGSVLQECGVEHFEEPCPYWELEWTAEVAAALDLDVAGGEQDTDLAQFRRMARLKAVDIVQPDICYLGGFSRSLEAGRLGLPCTPHAANLTFVTVFTLHLLSALPQPGKYLEYCIEDWDWQHGIFEPALEVKDGKIRLPESEAGWGVRVRADWLAKAQREQSSLS